MSKTKIFCIGANKTGTTSVEKALIDHGFKMGNQSKAQNLIENYKNRDFKSIIKYCKTAEAFQDAPFSWHYTFMFLDQAFPYAKFILTVRDNEEVWYKSIVSFQTKLFGKNGDIPTKEDLSQAHRTSKRTVWDNMNVRHELDEKDPYNKDMLVNYYLTHNKAILDYFRFKDNLIVINLAENNVYQRYCDFLGLKPLYDNFPWENKTSEL